MSRQRKGNVSRAAFAAVAAAAVASGVARRKHGLAQEPITPLEALH